MNVDPTIPAASIVPILILTTISHLSKRAHESDASVEKVDAFVGKEIVLKLNPSLQSSDEKFFGPCPIIEEMKDTQDPAVTISGANPCACSSFGFVYFTSFCLHLSLCWFLVFKVSS